MSLNHLCQNIIAPGLAAYLNTGIRPEIQQLIEKLKEVVAQVDPAKFEAEEGIPQNVLNRLHKLNFFALTIPQEYGGLGATMYEFAQVISTLASYETSLVVTAVPHMGNGVKSFLLFGSEDQKQDALANLCRDRRLISFAITESHTGSNVAAHTSRLTRREDGSLVLNGSKTWITNVPYAGHIVVVAKCPGLSKVPDGSAMVMVKPTDAGFSISKSWQKLGINGSRTVDLFFDDIVIPEDRIIGTAGVAMQQFSQVVGSGRLGVASGTYGIAQRAVKLLRKANLQDPICLAHLERMEYRLFMMKAAMDLGAFCLDLNNELNAVAMAKTFCSISSLEIVQDVHDLFLTQKGEVPDALAQLQREIPIWRVVEGPNEVLNYRAALDMVTSLRRPLEDGGLAWLPAKHQALGEAFKQQLAQLHEFLMADRNAGRLVMAQNLLARVSDYVKHAFVMLAGLTALVKHEGTPEQSDYVARFFAETREHGAYLKALDSLANEAALDQTYLQIVNQTQKETVSC